MNNTCIVMLCLATYFFIGSFTRFIPAKEIFPFFSWNLFASVPETQTEYAVKIIQDNKHKLPVAVFFQEYTNNPNAHSVIPLAIIQKMGRAYENNDKKNLLRYRKGLELNYLGPSISYLLVKITYHPLERWYTKQYKEEKIASFTTAPHLERSKIHYDISL